MRIARIQVDAFLGLRRLDVDLELPAAGGLALIEGPNEAGKTTLLRFVRQMLFGGSEQIRGGLVLEHEGRGYRLTREAKGKRYALRDMASGAAADVSLDALVGHLEAKVYQSVFAFGLDELRTLASLTGDDVQERIYSASVAGAGRNARAAMRGIVAEMEALLLPRATTTHIARLASELKDARRAAEAAGARAGEYTQLRLRERELDTRARVEQEGIAGLQAEKAKTEKLIAMWPDWRERMELLVQLSDAGDEAASDEHWLAAEAEIARLADDLGAQRQRLTTLRDLGDGIDRAERSVRLVLGRLGDAWDEERVATFGAASAWRAVAGGAKQRRTDAERGLRDADVQLAAAERNLGTARERAAQAPVPEGDARIFEAAVRRAEHRVVGVAELEGAWDERSDVDRSIRELAAAIAGIDVLARRGSVRRWLGWGLAWAAPLVAAALLWGGAWGVPAVLVGLAALLGVLLWPGGGRERALNVPAITEVGPLAVPPEGASPEGVSADEVAPENAPPRLLLARQLERAYSHRAEVERRVEDLAAELDLDPAGGRSVVRGAAARFHGEHERAKETAAAHLDAARAFARAAAEEEHARDQVKAASAAREAARHVLAEVSTAWRSWCERHGVPLWVAPGDLDGFLDGVGSLQEQVIRVRADRERMVALRQEAAMFGKAVRAMRSRLPAIGGAARPSGPAAGAATADTANADTEPSFAAEVALWQARVGAARQRRAWRERVSAIEARLETMFGAGAQDARERLDRREPLVWQAELTRLEQAIVAAQEALAGSDGIVARRRDAQRAREALETAADLAQHAAQAEVAREGLHASVRRWLVLRLAADQIEGTLAEYQRDRVPAVLRHAADTLAIVTGGRYVGVRQDEEGSLTLVTPDERLVGVTTVSRGTQEQLYLALRLGLVDAFAEQRGSLPLVMDDVLVNADPERSEVLAEVIGRTARRHQVLYLTCHPHTVERLRSAAPDSIHVRLERLESA